MDRSYETLLSPDLLRAKNTLGMPQPQSVRINIGFNAPIDDVMTTAAGDSSLHVIRLYCGSAGVGHAVMRKNACIRIEIADARDADGTCAPTRLFGEIDLFHAAKSSSCAAAFSAACLVGNVRKDKIPKNIEGRFIKLGKFNIVHFCKRY
jgi:hypothetical protein